MPIVDWFAKGDCGHRILHDDSCPLCKLGESVKASNYWQERFARVEKVLNDLIAWESPKRLKGLNLLAAIVTDAKEALK